MNKQSVFSLETRPASLQFRDGVTAGTIYAHRVGGRIVEAYRGYGFGYAPLAPVLRTTQVPGPEPRHSEPIVSISV